MIAPDLKGKAEAEWLYSRRRLCMRVSVVSVLAALSAKWLRVIRGSAGLRLTGVVRAWGWRVFLLGAALAVWGSQWQSAGQKSAPQAGGGHEASQQGRGDHYSVLDSASASAKATAKAPAEGISLHPQSPPSVAEYRELA